MVTVDELYAAGYKRYASPSAMADALMQRTIYTADEKIKYFINAYEYKLPDRVSYTFEAVMHRGTERVDVRMGSETATIEQVEALFEEVFEKMGFDIDPNNN